MAPALSRRAPIRRRQPPELAPSVSLADHFHDVAAQCGVGDSEGLEGLAGQLFVTGECEQQVFGADVVVVQPAGLLLGAEPLKRSNTVVLPVEQSGWPSRVRRAAPASPRAGPRECVKVAQTWR